jgi:hypothetical protein
MAPLTSPASMTTKLEIESLNQIGIFSKPTVTCSTTLFHAMRFPHILFMLIAERTYHFMMLPLPINYLFWELWVLTHQVRVLRLDKRSPHCKQTTQIFYQIQMGLLEV